MIDKKTQKEIDELLEEISEDAWYYIAARYFERPVLQGKEVSYDVTMPSGHKFQIIAAKPDATVKLY